MSSGEDFEEYRCEIITKVTHFSGKNINSPCSLVQHGRCHHSSTLFAHFSVEVYANGIHGENEGYVSAILNTSQFRYEPFMKNFDLACVFSVLDATGQKRYPSQFVFPFENTKSEDSFVLPRILSRETLLSEPNDLLPDDCLTLYIDVFIRSWSDETIDALEDFVKDSFELRKPGEYVLHLDSKLGQHLIEESLYFKLMSETPMMEKQRGYTIFHGEEYLLFREICFILVGVKNLIFRSLKHILQIYAAADKYRVRVVIRSCRGLLSTLFRAAEKDSVIKKHIAEEVPLILKLADTCNDVDLKEIVKSFCQRSRYDANKNSLTPDTTRDHLETEWRLSKVGGNCWCFVFARGHPEEENFDFYQ